MNCWLSQFIEIQFLPFIKKNLLYPCQSVHSWHRTIDPTSPINKLIRLFLCSGYQQFLWCNIINKFNDHINSSSIFHPLFLMWIAWYSCAVSLATYEADRNFQPHSTLLPSVAYVPAILNGWMNMSNRLLDNYLYEIVKWKILPIDSISNDGSTIPHATAMLWCDVIPNELNRLITTHPWTKPFNQLFHWDNGFHPSSRNLLSISLYVNEIVICFLFEIGFIVLATYKTIEQLSKNYFACILIDVRFVWSWYLIWDFVYKFWDVLKFFECFLQNTWIRHTSQTEVQSAVRLIQL